jgi:diguanylate cyclase (GGDEF)-like protein
MVVEDDLDGPATLCHMLEGAGDELALTRVDQLDAVVHRLGANSSSCIVLDLSLRDAPGVAALNRIRSTAPDVPIVAVSEQCDDQLARLVLRHGAQDYLCKEALTAKRLRDAVVFSIERKQSEARFAHQAMHDPLTGLPNRALFLDRLAVALDRSRRTRKGIGVLFLDVDGFKRVNDTLGHSSGDQLLITLADRIKGMLRPSDTVARFGGDEFTLLLEGLSGEREVAAIAERIAHVTSVPVRVGHREVPLTLSIGVALVNDPAADPSVLIAEADAAMYRAKELGRDRYELFDEDSRRRAVERLELEHALRHAIEYSQLRVHYQPEVSLGEDGVIGFEALVRWEHPTKGLLEPSAFIPLAEETGLVIDIGAFVLGEALAQLGRWRGANPGVTISVNVSARQLEDTGLLPMLDSAIRVSGAQPSGLRLEVTEAAVTRNPESALRMLEAIKTLGVTLAIDDFGTGNSSLANLKRLPVDWLKIDQSFISGLGNNSSADTPIARAVIELAHALGLGTIAEGVETEGQLARLREIGCDGAQGYLLGRPVPEQEANALLRVS